jgi:ribosomal protein L37E
MKERVLFLFFFFWAIGECIRKILHRKEIPCPHCGFDMTWYRRDVRIAKKIVEDFWKKNPRNTPKESSHI